MSYLPCCDVLWVGSYPFVKVPVTNGMLAHFPQLPQLNKRELMLTQLQLALKRKDFSFAPRSAACWKSSLQKTKGDFFKTQLAGPLTAGKPAGWINHAKWQIGEIQKKSLQPILVLDEPILTDPTSAEISYLKKNVLELKRTGALIGIHTCNDTNIKALLETGVNLVNFDAIHYPERLISAKIELQNFMRTGGLVGWGIISTTEIPQIHALRCVEEGFLGILSSLVHFGLPLSNILAQSMIAPVCGTGNLKVSEAKQVLKATTTVSKNLKIRYNIA